MMQPLISNIIELEKKYQFHADDTVYDDEILNQYYRHCKFLSDYQIQIISENSITMKEILYSLYYWGHHLMERSDAISLSDAGFEQWHFQLIGQIEAACGEVDFALLENIENDEVNI